MNQKFWRAKNKEKKIWNTNCLMVVSKEGLDFSQIKTWKKNCLRGVFVKRSSLLVCSCFWRGNFQAGMEISAKKVCQSVN